MLSSFPLMIMRAVAASLWLALAFAIPAKADERILNFSSYVDIQKNGDLIVTERITVRAEGREIRRGIYRDFPLTSPGADGKRHKVGFEVLSVARDGTREPYFTKNVRGGVRIYIGDANRYLRRGNTYAYTLKYRTTRQLRFYKEYDELYWNVTGNLWNFPIDRAEVLVRLPEGGKVRQHAAYTGRAGEKGKNFRVMTAEGDEYAAETKTAMGRREGLTVAVGWQKGIVTPPGAVDSFLNFLTDNAAPATMLAGLFGIFGFLFRSWKKYGVDPERGVIIPRFEAPRGLSPAAVGYIHDMGASGDTPRPLIAAMLNLAIKGFWRIENFNDEYSVHRPGKEKARDALPPGEYAVLDNIFPEPYEGEVLDADDKVLTFDRSNKEILRYARDGFKTAINHEYGRNQYFATNRGISGMAIAISLAIVGFATYLLGIDDANLPYLIGFGIAALGSGVLWYISAVMLLNRRDPGAGKRIAAYIMIAIGLVVSLGASAVFSEFVLGILPLVFTLPIVVLVVINVLFTELMIARSPEGQKIMDEIDGFKMYLSVAEKERLNMSGAPEVDQLQFEKLLPYAVALGVEEPWSNAFSSHLAVMAEKTSRYDPHYDRLGYSPSWYSGTKSWAPENISYATSSMMASMSSSVASAVEVESSSGGGGGGSFGGGSSGGGGGGGGGGGW